MDFNIETIAREYVYGRFPQASVPEKEKLILDWINKSKHSKVLIDDIKKRACDPAQKKVLDVGSGNGGLTIALYEAGAIPTGIEVEQDLFDISKKHAEARHAKIDFFLYEGATLPFADNVFDLATSMSVLEHTTDPVMYLREILRVTKPGGFLYLGFPNKIAPRETHTRVWFLTYLPAKFRPWVLSILKKNPLEENNLHFYGYFDLLRIITASSGKYQWTLIEEKGSSQNLIKNLLKKVLGAVGLPYKFFLPHILVVLQKTEKKS